MPRAKGRSVMFACRLNEEEAEALDSLLSLAEDDSCQSTKFRSIILELHGCIKRDAIGKLEYEEPKCEQTANVKVENEELNPELRRMFDKLNGSLR